MTPKEKYEYQKAKRKARNAAMEPSRTRDDDAEELFVRIVTALERLADVAELLSSELLETDKGKE